MLDNGTKRRIDTARDILVGKLPDPKSQVEQITIALIYKFMDDMDKQSEELGGKAKFFTGEYKKYAWSKIFDPRVSGYELVGLYGEAIQRMNHSPNIPQLFRDIFKNAYLPYRDPETLKSFLKIIAEFEYDHSEKLGDAFEYLLSIMGSQGDAGQFRTPRHIIDFMVKVVDPCKDETILDPACGTAGFLISSFKHIQNKNRNKKDGKISLTPHEKRRLIENFSGYDISPDMVRLSLVNMYLHGFQNPKIHEYDTLTSEDKWQEVFDVILANPPFMSPKGGIKPHKRFSVQAKRSEVLFVDYMAEHLNPNGRAGIIVPEGIIFQSGTAYKKLRKMLIEHSLYAVVSLPAGVFNPYSGVKTSILFLDKNLAKKTDTILFVKVNNDGFGLGAQRREIKENDLPKALEILHSFCHSRKSGNPDWTPEQARGEKLSHLVKKTKIAKSGDYNLSGERYKDSGVMRNQVWPLVRLSDLFLEIKNGKNVNQQDEIGKYRVSRIQTISNGMVDLMKTKWTSDQVKEEAFLQDGDILLSHINSIEHLAKTAIFENIGERVVHGINLIRFRPNKERINPKFAIYVFKSVAFIDKAKSFAQKAVNQASIKTADLKNIKIPLPPLEVQEQIVAELDSYQKIIDGAKQVVENYKPIIRIDPSWEMVELEKVAEIDPKKTELKSLDPELEVSFLPMSNLQQKEMHFSFKQSRKLKDVIKGYTYFRDNDVLLAKITPCFENGKSGIVRNSKNGIGFGSTEFIVLRSSEQILPEWLYLFVSSDNFLEEGKNNMTGSAGQQRLTKCFVEDYKIYLPPIEIQKEIVSKIESEQKIIDENKKLIEIFEAKIKDKIQEAWGK
jgi:type I restriction enzyme M protein